ncbi:MAG TPA: glucan biosynthesis protein, partial [Rudaea sp.]
GLSIAASDGTWTWRPLVNPKRLLVTSFEMTSPKGFGLMQRTREFVSYEDINGRYESHPSAWVEPIGDWGKGRVELVEIPSPDETNDNIVAYWIDADPVAAGHPIELHYRLHWVKDDAKSQPQTAWVARTLRGNGGYPKPEDGIGFTIDYEGPMFASLPPDAKVDAAISTDANATVLARETRRNPTTGGWRVALRIQRVDPNKPVELRASLRNDGKESETWSYILPPD